MALLQKFMYVYIIQCSDDTYYTGVTHSLYARYIDHETGASPGCYTYNRRPFKCLYWEVLDDPSSAIYREKQIKGWSRAKKRALMEGDIQQLKKEARKKWE